MPICFPWTADHAAVGTTLLTGVNGTAIQNVTAAATGKAKKNKRKVVTTSVLQGVP
jgi:hypothetical protein